MIDAELTVMKQIDKILVYKNDNFDFENMDALSFYREDFLVNFDEIEKAFQNDENILKEIDAELNKIVRKNRQAQANSYESPPDSNIFYFGSYGINGHFESKTVRVKSQQNNLTNSWRQKRQMNHIEEIVLSSLHAQNVIS